MSQFDPDVFLSQTVVGALDTKTTPIPAGEYPITVEAINGRKVPTKDGERTVLEVTWSVEDVDGTIKSVTRRDKNTCRQSVWLDITPEGALDMSPGANVDLGKLRAAVGQNDATEVWSFSMLHGQRAMGTIVHTVRDGDTFANIKSVRALG